MPDDVRDRLDHDAVGGDLDARRKLVEVGRRQRDDRLAPGGQGLDLLVEPTDQPQRVDRRRPQLARHDAGASD